MAEDATTKNLIALAGDLYSEGYSCGINDQRWLQAWAEVMKDVVNGTPYIESAVAMKFKELFPD